MGAKVVLLGRILLPFSIGVFRDLSTGTDNSLSPGSAKLTYADELLNATGESHVGPHDDIHTTGQLQCLFGSLEYVYGAAGFPGHRLRSRHK